MLEATDYIIFAFGVVIIAVWMFFYAVGRKYQYMFDCLNKKDFLFKELYSVGYSVLVFARYKFDSKADRDLKRITGALYGEKYAEYYVRVIWSQKITIAFIVLLFAVPLYGFTDEKMIFVIMLLFSLCSYYYFGDELKKLMRKREDEMLNDFTNIISKLALLTNSGMILKEAWEEVAYTGDTALYVEMRTVVSDMKNGKSETDALYDFGNRCMVPEIRKCSSTIVQALIKGNSELSYMLLEQSREVWSMKKQKIKREGEKAAGKLLIPIFIIFIGILIMIMVPVFTNMGV